MGKTTVFVDEVLIRRALDVTHLKTKKEVVEFGLRELIRSRDQKPLQEELGSFDLNLSLRELDGTKFPRILFTRILFT
jgi:Arc/MetJ family transcription regulator